MALVARKRKAKDKIHKSRRQLAGILAGLKSQGKSIVLATGAFDLVHVGHSRFLEDAKSRGDFLVVVINGDKVVTKAKGKGYPIQNEADRVEMIAGLEAVDYVIALDDEDLTSVIDEFDPTVIASGETNERDAQEKQAAKAVGAKLLACGDKKAHSTTKIVEKIGKRKLV